MTKNTEQRLKDIAQAVNERLPEGFGYIVMDGDKDSGKKNRQSAESRKSQRLYGNPVARMRLARANGQRRGRPDELATINDEVRKI